MSPFLKSPMPGTVVSVAVSVGDTVYNYPHGVPLWKLLGLGVYPAYVDLQAVLGFKATSRPKQRQSMADCISPSTLRFR